MIRKTQSLRGMETLLDDVRADRLRQLDEGKAGSCRQHILSMQRRLQAGRVVMFLALVGCTATAGAWLTRPQIGPDHSRVTLDDVTRVLAEPGSSTPSSMAEKNRAVTVGTLRVLEFIEQLKAQPPPTDFSHLDCDAALRRIQKAAAR